MALIGNTNEEKIWNYLYEKIKNPYGVAGVIGNMYAESALQPNNLQQIYKKKLGFTDITYTKAVDNGTYTNFIYDKAGYGLVQWAYWSLKRDLFNYIKSKKTSIGDLEIQLEFLCKQLSENYTIVWETLKNATSVLEASNIILLKFKRSADQGAAAQQKRAEYSQKYYDKYVKRVVTNTPAVLTEKEEIITMAVKIGHASIDENGRATGGTAGDQTGREICIRSWYNKPWLKVIRPTSSIAAEKIAVAMEQACSNDNIGYGQYERTTCFAQAKACNWDLSKINIRCETDCSALVAACVNAAGISVSKDMHTGNEEAILTRTGKFTVLTSNLLINSSDYLKRGDILLAKGHTAIVLSNGTKASTIAGGGTTQPIAGNTIYVGKGIGTATAKMSMSIRTGAGTNYQIIDTIKTGVKVEVLAITETGWYKIVWPSSDSGYAYTSNSTGKYFSYKEKIITTNTISTITNFTIKITADILNIRKGPGTDYPITGTIKDKGVYTIVKTNGNWGYLKSGGWISLNYTKKE